MAKVDVVDWENKKVGQVDLSSEIFEQPVKKSVLHSVIRWQLASRRRGTHKAKTRGEVSGGGKKPFKQKGTGSARQGSSRSPVLVGGGTVFPPKPRDYSYVLPKKLKQEGLKSALSHLFASGHLVVLNEMTSTEGRTKELAGRLNKLGLKKTVLISGKEDKLMSRAARNMPKVRYYTVAGLNVYDLLKYDSAVLAKDSLSEIAVRCGLDHAKASKAKGGGQ